MREKGGVGERERERENQKGGVGKGEGVGALGREQNGPCSTGGRPSHSRRVSVGPGGEP